MVDKNGLHEIRKELLEMIPEEKRVDAEKILNRILGEQEQEEIIIHPNMFVGMLPEDIQDEIRKEVTSYLKKDGSIFRRKCAERYGFQTLGFGWSH